ncbi:MAG: hypothetical protein ACE37I_10460 [Rubinisphaera brasiliensis]|uniref:hypothetical protein n=1 Tax=Rubinisphaera brasiliensis TaxID=119 RepID=UPI00391DC7D2
MHTKPTRREILAIIEELEAEMRKHLPAIEGERLKAAVEALIDAEDSAAMILGPEHVETIKAALLSLQCGHQLTRAQFMKVCD